MTSHDRQAPHRVPTQEEIEAYIRHARELRSQTIARHAKSLFARVSSRLRSTLGHWAGSSHQPDTTAS